MGSTTNASIRRLAQLLVAGSKAMGGDNALLREICTAVEGSAAEGGTTNEILQRLVDEVDAMGGGGGGGGEAEGNAVAGDVRSGKTFSSSSLIGALGTAIVASGDAVEADVASGKTFSNAGAAGLTGSAIISTGAAVASDVRLGVFFSNELAAGIEGTSTYDASVAGPSNDTILPYDAWVSFMAQAWGTSPGESTIDLSVFAVSHFSADPLTVWLGKINTAHATANLDLSGGSLNLTDVNNLIEILATSGSSNPDILDISGGTSAAPTLSAGRVDGTWVLTVTGVPVGSFELVDFAANTTGPATFGADIDVSSANNDTIAENIKIFIDTIANQGWSTVRVNNAVTVTVISDAALPLTAGTDSATNFTIADTAGSPSYIGRIEARGGSVTHN